MKVIRENADKTKKKVVYNYKWFIRLILNREDGARNMTIKYITNIDTTKRILS